MKPDKYLSNFYPNAINATKYRSIVDTELEKMYNAIRKKFSYDDAIKKLPKFQIPTEDTDDKSITFSFEFKNVLSVSFEKTKSSANPHTCVPII